LILKTLSLSLVYATVLISLPARRRRRRRKSRRIVTILVSVAATRRGLRIITQHQRGRDPALSLEEPRREEQGERAIEDVMTEEQSNNNFSTRPRAQEA
jgi:hypothetical protein